MPLVCAGAGVFPSPPLLLFSLMALLSSLTLVSLEPAESLFTSSEKAAARLGARQVAMDHCTPVKLLIWKPRFSHRLHGLPVRSRARRPALMAPWLAFGPSFGTGAGAAKAPLARGSLTKSPLAMVSTLGCTTGGILTVAAASWGLACHAAWGALRA